MSSARRRWTGRTSPTSPRWEPDDGYGIKHLFSTSWASASGTRSEPWRKSLYRLASQSRVMPTKRRDKAEADLKKAGRDVKKAGKEVEAAVERGARDVRKAAGKIKKKL